MPIGQIIVSIEMNLHLIIMFDNSAFNNYRYDVLVV